MGPAVAVGELAWSGDAHAAAWVLDGVRPFDDYTVGSLLPGGFAAYGRVFHPAHLSGSAGTRAVRWEDVARANGRRAHPAMEWGSITGSWQLERQEGLWDREPETGSLPLAQGEWLAAVLARHTATQQRCWFAIWEGFGDVAAASEGAPRVEMPQRPMWLLHGPLAGAAASTAGAWGRSASLWWPDDRAWCVATDVDLMTTYVGASNECISSVLAAEDLEAMAVPVSQGVTWETDSLNPPVRPPS